MPQQSRLDQLESDLETRLQSFISEFFSDRLELRAENEVGILVDQRHRSRTPAGVLRLAEENSIWTETIQDLGVVVALDADASTPAREVKARARSLRINIESEIMAWGNDNALRQSLDSNEPLEFTDSTFQISQDSGKRPQASARWIITIAFRLQFCYQEFGRIE